MRTTMNTKLVMLLGLVGLASCAEQQLVTADKAYDRMAYSKAACNYEKVLGRRADRDAAIRAAHSYQQLNNLGKTIEFYRMAGDVDYLLKVQVASVKDYDRVYRDLISRIDLADVSATFAMECIKNTTELPL